MRNEYKIILDFIGENSSVIDLGCGSGDLLRILRDKKGIRETGIEISLSGVQAAKESGLNVFQGSIDSPLPFNDNQFDFSVCNVTIQMVMFPEILIKEMKRISRHLIISFPNFAFYKNRIDLMFNGRMPKPLLFGYEWYSTGHIHQFSVSDFNNLVRETGGLKISDCRFHEKSTLKKNLMNLFPNLFLYIPVFLIEKCDE
ncbi:MAG: methionine biosynthesis protein MetW [Ignavibacteriaceae bacterium]